MTKQPSTFNLIIRTHPGEPPAARVARIQATLHVVDVLTRNPRRLYKSIAAAYTHHASCCICNN